MKKKERTGWKRSRRGDGWRGRGRLFLVLCSSTIAVSSLFVAGCKEKVKPGTAEIRSQVVKGVVVQEVRPSRVDEYYETSATVRAKTTTMIASRIMGVVTSVKVREGDRVRAGQVLISIDDSDSAEKVAAAEAGEREALKALEAAKQNKALADITYRRYKGLVDEKVITQQELDQIETQKRVADIECERVQEMVNRAKAGLSEARIYHGFTRVTSPFSGIVTEKKIEQGGMAVPGAPLMTVEDPSSFRLDVNVAESLLGKMRTGMPVDIVLESIGKNLKGRISEIVPAVDPLSRTFLVKVEVPVEGLRSGLYAKVRIPVGTKEALVVPGNAIVEKGQLTGVYTVDEKGIIAYRLIRTGKRYEEGFEIVSGINPGDKIISEGSDRAMDGGILDRSDKKQEPSQTRQR
ncbi:MAG TPA: efflux RND transporter periplasmic adaptor subunit [Thermodesulfovibrionales bacterium]|jgi:RND family efflux transporter MFP subunit|nr:efflux RND transporter periplasmic adaptor subunit [Thermodesulfovibrionales bacterium]